MLIRFLKSGSYAFDPHGKGLIVCKAGVEVAIREDHAQMLINDDWAEAIDDDYEEDTDDEVEDTDDEDTDDEVEDYDE